MSNQELPIPLHFDLQTVGEVWRVPYQERAAEAEMWAKKHDLRPAEQDSFRVCLVAVDVQNTFCLPEFELFVAGQSGTGAIHDNRRLCGFIYRNLAHITQICPTMDTHQAMQIFHSIFLINENGEHPDPFTLISAQDIADRVWKFNTPVAEALGFEAEYGAEYIEHYTRKLGAGGKYDLTIWPYHAMLGGIGHALVSAVEEAIFFHSIARLSQPDVQVKGNNPLTENYSVLSPEILNDASGKKIANRNQDFLKKLLDYDAVVIAGQAKSHCVAWTISDLLNELRGERQDLVRKVYLLEDCMSPVVVPGVIDYTEQADATFAEFAEAGMNLVKATDPLASWPGIQV
ncbi:isochorismatase [bacterium]|nr:isochorismatase [bacterium]